jgi:transcriptional regulator with XRE-family HTH domain
MDSLTLGQRLIKLRQALDLTQQQVAELAGTTQPRYSEWERDARLPAGVDLDRLARVLRVEREVLESAREMRSVGRPSLPSFLAGRRSASEIFLHDNKATLEDMRALGPLARRLCSVARSGLPVTHLDRLSRRFPRDSAVELLAVFHLFPYGARLALLTLAQLLCPVLCVTGAKSARSGAFLKRDCILVEIGSLSLVFFPQVWVVSVVQSEWYRLDFLCFVRRIDGAEGWVCVEIDGSGHLWTPDRDKRRIQGLPVRRIAFDAREVLREDFVGSLVRRLASCLDPVCALPRGR